MTELTKLKGIGEKTAGAFSRLGIFSAEDLVRYYPRDYETFGAPVKLYEAVPGMVCAVEGILQKDASLNRFNGLTVVNAYLSDMTGRLQLSWFNLPYIKQSLKSGAHYVFRGRITEKNGRVIMNQPRLYRPEDYREKYEGRLMPVYPLTKGVTNGLVTKAVTQALGAFSEQPDFLPPDILSDQELLTEREALIRIHFPRSREELLRARERLCFDEFLLFMLAGKRLRETIGKTPSEFRCRPDYRIVQFIAGLPFELTKAQQKAYREIIADMNSGRVMQRLLEGDVGSGKTIVAVLAMLHAAMNGLQAAIMAPTEVLAGQHFEKLTALMEQAGLPFETVLLTGSLSAAERREALGKIQSGEAKLIVGTHALFQEGVEYSALGLIVTDEQHRFGVSQREALRKKGPMPHVLMMSATPIPRTLALMLYGDLDLSIIDALPGGRKRIRSCVVGPGYRPTAYKFILDEIGRGRQAYVICAAIEAGDREDGQEDEGLRNVTDYSAELKRLFRDRGVRIGVLHGRMKNEEKESAMADFRDHRTDILVSTTVVEVGVDVPNATVILIEDAQQFGLAQLHQLRGRVGRGEEQSYCILLNTSDSDRARERLEIVNSSTDGFEIASKDLEMRGPGDIFGVRQSGELAFELADVYNDGGAMKKAKEVAEVLERTDPELSGPGLSGLSSRLADYMKNGQNL